jgi:metallo-beta-lactamase family protein
MKIQFWGATETVTGSRYLVSSGETNILVDCGLFQGYKNLRLRNWEKFPVDPYQIDAILLTHAHLDHSGYIPLLIKNGFCGKIFCTPATKDLCSLLLKDSGFLQEEEAKFANRHHFSKHKPALPLYTEKDAERSMDYFVEVKWNDLKSISKKSNSPKIEFEFFPAGHLFGAASILIQADGKSIVFSGDLGRTADPITRRPDFKKGADYLVVESTYGNREHDVNDPETELKKIILRTFERKGTLIIPSFAVGRAQIILHYILQLKNKKLIPNIPIYLNSPMALSANEIYSKHFAESKLSYQEVKAFSDLAHPITSMEESIALNERKDPMIIIAASGMATGGRVLHHLKAFAGDAKNTILFVGFQAGGSRGEAITKGAKEIKIHGEYFPVRAEVVQLESLSAHADRSEIVKWIQAFEKKPKQIFITHGEPIASDVLRRSLNEKFVINTDIPTYGQSFDLN